MPYKTPARYPSRGGFFCLLFCSLSAQAQPAEPLVTRDQNPLVSIYGLPLPVNARLLAAGKDHWLTSFNLTNTINVDNTANSELIVDTESSQLDLIYTFGLSDDWMLRLHFGVTHHGTGYFDSWIYNYHDLLGLKQGDRDLIANDQFQIYVSENNNTLIDLQTAQSGISDTQIQLGYQLTRNTNSAASLWTSIKLPTGDSNKLTGSGSTDIALWLATQLQHNESIWFYSQLGGLTMHDTDVLKLMHQHTAWFGNLGLNYIYDEVLQFKTQIDAHTPLYNSQLDFLDTAIQLTFGGTITIDENNVIDIAMSEDIKTRSSPDVTLNVSWRWGF